MSSLGNNFEDGLLGLNHTSICNPDFTWVRSADRKPKIPKTWFSVFTQTASFKKTTWIGTVPFDNKCFMTSLKLKTLRRKRITID